MSCPLPSTSDAAGPGRDEQARAVCLRLLTARARTRSELTNALVRRGFGGEVIERVLDRLAEIGLVDDVDFAEQWVRSRREHAGKGKRALAAELRTKGVDAEIITSALAGVDADAERARAADLAAARVRRERLDDPAAAEKVLRRLVGMLARRGYHPSMALDVATLAVRAEQERRAV